MLFKLARHRRPPAINSWHGGVSGGLMPVTEACATVPAMPTRKVSQIMSKLRYVLLVALALCAFGTTAAAASAHEYLVGGKPIPEGFHIKFHVLVETHWLLLGTPFGVAVHISCLEGFSLLGGLLFGGTSLQSLTWTGCKVTKPAGCTTGTITSKTKGTLLSASETEFSPETGTAFTTITLEGASCSLKGQPFEVTGTQKCLTPEAESEKELHEVECKTSGSALKAGGKPATLEGLAAGIHIINEKGEATKELYSAI
jgi:hypothetical protein